MEDLNIKKIKDRVCREDKLSKTLLQKNKELKDIFIISDEERCLHLIDILSSYGIEVHKDYIDFMKENDNYKKVEELILNEKTNEIIEEANRAFFDLNNEIYDNMFGMLDIFISKLNINRFNENILLKYKFSEIAEFVIKKVYREYVAEIDSIDIDRGNCKLEGENKVYHYYKNLDGKSHYYTATSYVTLLSASFILKENLVIPPDEDIFNDLKEIAINQIVQKEKDTLKILSSFKKKEETNSNLLKKKYGI